MWTSRGGRGAACARGLGVALTLCLASAVAQSTGTSGTWTALGPFPTVNTKTGAYGDVSGRITGFAFGASGTVYVSSVGGIWKSGDGGFTWTPLTDGIAAPLSGSAYGAIAVDPEQATTLYAGMGEPNGAPDSVAGQGLVVSSDGGGSWSGLASAQFSGLAIDRILVDPKHSSHLLVAAVTAAGGVGAQPGLYGSTNSGQSWTLLIPGQAWDVVWDGQAANGATLVAAVGGGLWRSVDGGASFTAVSSAVLPATVGRSALALSASQPGRVLALMADAQGKVAGLFSSGDDGLSWTALTTPSELFALPGASSASGASGQGLYDIALTVDPANGQHVWLGGIDLWESQDGGQTWLNRSQAYAVGPIAPAQHALAYSAGVLWIGDDGGVWTNAGGGFTDSNGALGVVDSVGALSANGSLWASVVDEGVVALSSGGSGQVAVGGRAAVMATGPALVAGQPAVLYMALPWMQGLERSSDGGVTWQAIGQPVAGQPASSPVADAASAAWLPPLLADASQPGVVYAATNRVWKSTDGGTSWTALSGSTLSTGSASALAAAAGVLYEASTQGQVWVSSDGGASWSEEDSGLPQRPASSLAVNPANGAQAWIGFGGWNGAGGVSGHVFATTNAGASWSNVSASLPDAAVNAIVVDPAAAGVLYAATDMGVFVSADGGALWQALGQGLPASKVAQVSIEPLATAGARELVAALEGRGLWGIPLQAPGGSLQVKGGNQQSVAAGQAVATALSVVAVNTLGQPIANASVTWSDQGAGGALTAATTTTNAEGQTQVGYTTPTRSGGVTIVATLSGNGGTNVSVADFSLTVQPLAAAAEVAFGGGGQSAVVDQPLPAPLEVQVSDRYQNPVPGVTVTFSDGNAGGSFAATSVVTNAQGLAAATYTLPAAAGSVQVTAQASGLTAVTFSETATPAPDFSFQLTATPTTANQNSVVRLQVATTAIGGSTAGITLRCSAPVTGCSAFSPQPVTPGGTASATLGTGALLAGVDNTVTVMADDGVHRYQQSVQVHVVPLGLTLAVAPDSGTVASGENATTVVTVSGSGGFTGAFALATSYNGNATLPTGVSVSSDTATPTLDASGNATVHLTVKTVAHLQSSVTGGGTRWGSGWASSGGWAMPGGLLALWTLLLCILARHAAGTAAERTTGARAARARTGGARTARVAGWLLLALLVEAGCGGGGAPVSVSAAPTINPNGATPGTYVLTITAAGSGVATPGSASFTLTVR